MRGEVAERLYGEKALSEERVQLEQDVQKMLDVFEEAAIKAEFLGFSHMEITKLWNVARVRHALNVTNGNVTHAANLLRMHRNSLARYMKIFGFDIKQWDRKGSRGAQKRKDRGVLEAPVYGNTV